MGYLYLFIYTLAKVVQVSGYWVGRHVCLVPGTTYDERKQVATVTVAIARIATVRRSIDRSHSTGGASVHPRLTHGRTQSALPQTASRSVRPFLQSSRWRHNTPTQTKERQEMRRNGPHPVADAEGAEPAPPPPLTPFGRRTDAATVLLISDNCKTCTSEYSKQEAPLSPRDRAMRRVS